MAPPTATDEDINYDINIPYTNLPKSVVQNSKYAAYLPSWEPISFPLLSPFPFSDPALRVSDPSLPNLRKNARETAIQPSLGTVLEGVQLTELSESAKDELAYLVAHRKVVVLPNQDLIDAGPAEQERFMRHFGKLNYQPVSGSISGHPAFHIIHRDGNKDEIDRFMSTRATTTLWHQDVSYEIQPPGYVMLGLLDGPEVGGDTVFAAADQAYSRLSAPMKEFLDKLEAVHSSANMISHARATGGLVRKEAVTTVHPIVRVHAVTGRKSLFVNNEFITRISDLKEAESRLVIDFLVQHMISGHDFQARVRWNPRSIVLFDNRSTIHTAVVDYIDDEYGAKPRHIFRLAAMAEKPIAVRDA